MLFVSDYNDNTPVFVAEKKKHWIPSNPDTLFTALLFFIKHLENGVTDGWVYVWLSSIWAFPFYASTPQGFGNKVEMLEGLNRSFKPALQ